MRPQASVAALLEDLSRQEIRVWAEGDRLRCAGPQAALTPELSERLRRLKADILTHLARETEGTTIPARNDPAPPLSFAQERLWFMERMMPEAGIHHMALAAEALGPLDLDRLAQALAAVIRRHAILRTRIGLQDGAPVQVIEAAGPAGCLSVFQVIDRRDRPLSLQERESLLHAEARRAFDLARQSPLRLSVVRLAPERALILLTLHHIAGDGWSLEILLRELADAYRHKGQETKPPLPIQYGDFAAWQRDHLAGPAAEPALAFWQQHLAAPLPATRLAGDFPRPAVQAHQGALEPVKIGRETADRLRALSSATGATLFATLFTAFAVLVHRLTGQTDLVIGTPVANRRHIETEGLIGLFVNPLPLRLRLRPAEPFRESLRRTQDTLWQVLAHQDLPFERLVEIANPARDPSMHPLFQLKFQLDAPSPDTIDLPGVTLTRLARADGIAKLDLSLNLQETGAGLHGAFEFDTALFRPQTVAALARAFETLVEGLAAHPETVLATLPLLSADDHARQIRSWNATQTAYDRAAFFPALFEAQVERDPDAIALVQAVDGQRRTESYGALNRRANQIAHRLRAQGVGPEQVVAIALERGFDMVAAWLGVLKAGGAYLPLDPAYPPGRIADMLEDSGATLVLTTSAIPLPDPLPSTARRIDLDLDWPQDASTEDPVSVSHQGDLAYLIYTSGSTGRPKGVMVEHRGLVNLVKDKIRVCAVGPDDCVLQFFSFSFDASIPEMVMALSAGARLVLLAPDEVLPGPALARRIEEERVTHLTMTPSALFALPAGAYPALRLVLTGGEAPTPELIARWGAGRRFINAYGPTETTVNASMVACAAGEMAEAVLRPAANKQLYVLDAHLEPLPPGVPGELHIGGLGIARGYHKRAALTAERFVPDPFATKDAPGLLYRTGDRACQLPDGRIRLLGRMDDQVKIRGYRIEPGEIEAMLLAHPQLAAAAVTVRELEGEKRVLAYAVARDEDGLDPLALRAWLAQRLPRYLVPDAVIPLERLPLTVNGKVDLAALPVPATLGEGTGRPPRGAMEEAIAACFSAVLGDRPVAATDDFFAIGGHSLLATRLCALAKERFGLEIAILDLFNAPTVEALAHHLAGGQDRAIADAPELEQDIRLDPAIRPAATEAGLYPPRTVLLTGATGFVGAYLLQALLRDPAREVTCLVRGADGLERLRRALSAYGLWQQDMAARLRVVAGDLASPGLGLSRQETARLAESVDAILHNGAEVHHLYPYQRLRAANVLGTAELLRLAAAGRGRPFHLISSLSALTRKGAGGPIRESDPVTAFPPPAGGYNRTKWASEHLVEAARARGLVATLYRPGAISGASDSGAFNADDILCRMMQGYLHSGAAPEGETLLAMLPVDYLARAVVWLMDRPDAAGQTFHLLHSTPVSSARLFEAAAQEGLDLKRLSRPEWRALLAQIAREDATHPLAPLMGLLEQDVTGEDGPGGNGARPIDHARTRAALAEAPFAEPPLDTALLRLYLRAFLRAGALDPSRKEEHRHG
ncbi:hypothetical protein BJF92_18245 [Rhizobium rhizosphaerae]|uniref:Carrier domain-containing protein n=1 Tax=Xaviernesmea rhizosphaerae TaxID=1672749 RepID=A0A1Q9ADI6_9HYPH|nr:non-ribosomal peptide synthetase [Xaviernesmea rhizosphaerae]OLP52980.1 hypothetical protein BJF92_18245 [Xaviernesmea rhizosphaerae]